MASSWSKAVHVLLQIVQPATEGGAGIEEAGPAVAPAPTANAVQQSTIYSSIAHYSSNQTSQVEAYGANQINSYSEVCHCTASWLLFCM